jgi:hypothetical protein
MGSELKVSVIMKNCTEDSHLIGGTGNVRSRLGFVLGIHEF